jgi:hypothetical protein
MSSYVDVYVSETKTNTDSTAPAPALAPASDSKNPFYGGIARALARGLALYFSRPVRLFRPSKVSGWTSLRGAAAREGVELTPQYISLLIKQKGVRRFVIHH